MKLGLVFTVICVLSLVATIDAASKEKKSKEKTTEISIDCTLSKVVYVFYNAQASCTLKSTKKIDKRNSKVISINGECAFPKPNPSVKVFYAVAKVVRYIPSGLDIMFPSLIGFRFESTQLTVVTKEDLQAFPNLLMFACVGNQIQFLEENLFMFNTKLQYVSFRANRIVYMHPTVFAHLSASLLYMYMDGQALACGLGNAVTPAGIKTALAKMGSSTCSDINNAPALYLMWLEIKIQLEDCEAGGQETTTKDQQTTTEQSTTTDESTTTEGSTTTEESTTTEGSTTTDESTTTDLTTPAGASELQQCQEKLDTEKTTSAGLQTKYDTCCAVDAANCPA